MYNTGKIIDLVVQKSFKKVLDAKKEGKLVDFRQELKDELISREKEIKEVSKNQWSSAEKLIDEIEKNKNEVKSQAN